MEVISRSNAEAVQMFNLTTAIKTLSHALQGISTTFIYAPTDGSSGSIDTQVQEVNALIPQLFSYRALLLRNINFRESGICKLPPETLAGIFRWACSSDSPGSLPPTKLGAICCYWRQIAWSTPRLWTDLVIGSRFWKLPPSQRLQLLNLHYKNAGGLLLDVVLAKSPDSSRKGPRGIRAEEIFEKIFIQNASKLKTLIFEELPNSWLPRLEKTTKSTGLPNLVSVAFLDRWHHPLPNPPALAIHNAPRLEKLNLEGVTAPLVFPWAQITELMLYAIDSERALEAVLQCLNLKVLKCDDLSRGNSSAFTVPNETVMFRHLEVLEYSGSYLSPSWEMALTKCSRFTSESLRKVTWLPGVSGLHQEFLFHLPTSVVDIHLACDKDYDHLEKILSRLTFLRDLTLHLGDPLDLRVLNLLTVKNGSRFLPSLSSLGLFILSERLADPELCCILDMTRSRWETRENIECFAGFVFGFPFIDQRAMKWPSEFVNGMEELVREGMEIHILGKGRERLGEWLDKSSLQSGVVTSG